MKNVIENSSIDCTAKVSHRHIDKCAINIVQCDEQKCIISQTDSIVIRGVKSVNYLTTKYLLLFFSCWLWGDFTNQIIKLIIIRLRYPHVQICITICLAFL